MDLATRFTVLFLLIAVSLAGQTFRVPVRNFAENVGQLESNALFGIDDRTFLRDRVQLASDISLVFEGASAGASVRGLEPQPFRVNDFRTANASRWRSNVPHFDSVAYSGLYPGIDASWRRAAAGLTLRITAAPGAQLDRLRFRIGGRANVSLFQDFAGTVWVDRFRNGFLAPVVAPGNAPGARAAFAVIEPDLFVLRAESYNAGLPLTIDIPAQIFATEIGTYVQTTTVDSSGRMILAGRDYLTRLRADGSPDFFTVFTGGLPQFAGVDRQGNHVLVGTSLGDFSVTPSAPQAEYRGGSLFGDLFLARFDAAGNLTASTYFGGTGDDRFESAAIGANGDVYVEGSGVSVPATPSAFQSTGSVFLVRWTPGQPRFAFSTYLPVGPSQIGVDFSGNVLFFGGAGEYMPTTPGVLEPNFIRRPQLYVGKLDAAGSRLMFGTFVPLGPPGEGRATPVSLVVHPSGGIWAAGRIDYPEGIGHVLVALSGDGRRLPYSEGSPGAIRLALDADGNVLAFGYTWELSHFTSTDAPLRAGCHDGASVYYRKFNPQGRVVYATYLPPWIAALDPQGRPYVTDAFTGANLRLYELANRPPEVVCVVNSAGRRPYRIPVFFGLEEGPNAAVTGGFVTIIGSSLPADARVRFDGVDAPVVASQPGLLTVRVPETYRGGTRLQVESAPAYRLDVVAADLALFTADGHGRGPAAAFFSDGSQNSVEKPAGPGDVLTVYGTGAGVAEPIELSFGARRAVIEYAGPAPGFPGITQINFRVPDVFEQGPRGEARVRVVAGPTRGSFPEARVVVKVR